jgi:hypothetical protein
MSVLDTLTPPTDNLYKFIAIAGFILLLFCIVYPHVLSQQIQDVLSLDKLDDVSTSAQMQLVGDKLEALLNRHYQIMESLSDSSKTNSPAYIATLTQENESLKKMSDKLSDLNDAIEEEGKDRQDAIEAKRQAALDEINYLLSFCQWMRFVGLFLMLLGFSLWYVKVQRFQDFVLERDARKAGCDYRHIKFSGLMALVKKNPKRTLLVAAVLGGIIWLTYIV